ncbi:ParM/StbA family protein (plasmid) [Paenibacillus polymyxa]|uniref:Actin-like protein N-terminal domain-containing protein n=1 Tax=Paenibacillus polymyxa TaxID=1406 RepID=A0A379LTC6_PAEPO|nr:ParM/StbA family protein [Paenibacillus polymyxa]MBE7901107.1 ParM/StbA family protein [Paenibacillus polymyxa]MBG9764556.1 hypothetical protein [Paenibacillus polymyxa]MCC3261690.1 ParM/StbA family protein [Paenibacillus polymyxa]QPK56334.1 ParM/StbA family protein [Paenibacillus polymyxa]QPK61351.1 ParM/StbA family protein [Paenibacillus polymyxa]
MNNAARALAADIGNDAVKAYLNGLTVELTIPNVVVDLEDRDIIDMEKDPLDALHVEITSTALKNNKRKVAVGNLATKYSNNDELTPEEEKSESDQPVILLLTAAALDAVMNGTPDEDGVYQVPHYLSTGLPLDEAKRGKRKAFRDKIKNGQHLVKFLKTPLYEGKTVRLQFEQVIVNTEGFAAYVDLTTNDDGSTKNEDLIGKSIIINDIGGLSTDTAVITKNSEVDNQFSDGIKKGVSTTLDNIIRKVAKEHKYEIKSRRVLVEIITNEKPEEQYHIWKNGNRVSIKDIIEPELAELAKEEYKLIKEVWRQVPDTRLAYQIGGGAVVLKNALTEINNKENQYPFRFVSAKESVWMIARAYFKILLMYLDEKGITITEAAATAE